MHSNDSFSLDVLHNCSCSCAACSDWSSPMRESSSSDGHGLEVKSDTLEFKSDTRSHSRPSKCSRARSILLPCTSSWMSTPFGTAAGALAKVHWTAGRHISHMLKSNDNISRRSHLNSVLDEILGGNQHLLRFAGIAVPAYVPNARSSQDTHTVSSLWRQNNLT